MILEEIKRGISRRVQEWSRNQPALAAGLTQNEPTGASSLSRAGDEKNASILPFTQPPPHVAADLCLPWPLQAAKLLKRKPIDVAVDLAAAFRGLEDVEAPQATPPGFVNFKLTSAALARNLAAIAAKPGEYGADPLARPRSILIEFVSANPTGPMHLASGRAAALGDSLARILRRIGHKIGAECYVNDAGRQTELLGLSVQARFNELKGRPAEFPEEGYNGEYIKDIAAAAPAEAASWQTDDFSRFAVEQMLSLHRADMDAYGVVFDRWYRESELHQAGSVDSALKFLEDRNMVVDKDGARWLNAFVSDNPKDHGKKLDVGAVKTDNIEELIKERVLVRKDGRPTYFLADVAYHKDKYDRGWEELVDIWGADHHGYVPRMTAAVAALGKEPDSFHAIVHQLVHLYRGKELVKMSKRAGEFVSLKELLEEVGKDACRFFFAQRTPNSHMNFDLELAKKQSQENPVYYVQYVHARICSIFREAQKAGFSTADTGGMNRPDAVPSKPVVDHLGAGLIQPEERALLMKLAWFPDALAACETALSPHPLPTYLLELAGLYHPFYEKCRVVDPADRPTSQARLALCAGVRDVIREGLGLLGVSAPQSM